MGIGFDEAAKRYLALSAESQPVDWEQEHERLRRSLSCAKSTDIKNMLIHDGGLTDQALSLPMDVVEAAFGMILKEEERQDPVTLRNYGWYLQINDHLRDLEADALLQEAEALR